MSWACQCQRTGPNASNKCICVCLHRRQLEIKQNQATLFENHSGTNWGGDDARVYELRGCCQRILTSVRGLD